MEERQQVFVSVKPFTIKMHADKEKMARIIDGAVAKARKTYGVGRRKIVRRANRRLRKCFHTEIVPYTPPAGEMNG